MYVIKKNPPCSFECEKYLCAESGCVFFMPFFFYIDSKKGNEINKIECSRFTKVQKVRNERQ